MSVAERPPARARRRDLLDLPFATEDTVRRISAAQEEPDWLLGERLDALRTFEELAVEPNRLFTSYVDVRAVRFDEIAPYLETGDATDLSQELPQGAAALLHVSEDRVVARALSAEARAAGITVDTWSNVLRSRPQLLRPYLEAGNGLPAEDKFAQLARAASALGVLVHVPAGVSLQGPIVVRWSVGAGGRGLVTRTVIVLERGSRASVLEEQVASPGRNTSGTGAAGSAPAAAQSLWWGTSEVHLGEGASLDVAGQQDLGASTAAFVNRRANLGANASLRWALASVGGLYQKSRIDNVLEGRGSSVRQVEIAFGSGTQHFDLTSYTRHLGEDTTGDLLSKGVFLDAARGYFKGLIEIHRSARGTDSYLGEFAMLLNKKARSVAIPSLEIDQPDVRRASHSSSVGPIDETQTFYLMSRGLDRETARKFIVLGFLEPVVSRIPLPDAQDRLRDLLDAKWSPAEQSAA